MNNSQKQQLLSELKSAGATKAEALQLAGVASNLSVLKASQTKNLADKKQAATGWHKLLVFGLPSLASLALGMFLIIASQSVLPGNLLFPVQAASDNVAISLDSSYRGTVMMKRADQVKQLVYRNAPAGRVYATLADYKNEAASYKSTKLNYTAFEYCKNSLKLAATKAPLEERQAINKTLSVLSDV